MEVHVVPTSATLWTTQHRTELMLQWATDRYMLPICNAMLIHLHANVVLDFFYSFPPNNERLVIAIIIDFYFIRLHIPIRSHSQHSIAWLYRWRTRFSASSTKCCNHRNQLKATLVSGEGADLRFVCHAESELYELIFSTSSFILHRSNLLRWMLITICCHSSI